MSSYAVSYDGKKGVLDVSSKDLLKDARKPPSDTYLEINRFIFDVEIPLKDKKDKEAEIDKQVQQKALHAATAATKDIEGRLVKMVNDLVDDLKKLARDDEAGVTKAAAEAAKRVDSVSKEVDKVLPEIGRTLRKAVERAIGPLPASIKSTSSGSFKGLELVYKFKGDAERYRPEHITLARAVRDFRKELEDNLGPEERLRTAYVKELQEYQALVVKQKKADEVSKKKFDERQFYQDNRPKADKVRRAGSEYTKHLGDFKKSNDEAAKRFDAKNFRENSRLKKALDELGTQLEKLNKQLEDRSRTVSNTANVVQDDELWDNVERDVYPLKDLNTTALDSALEDVAKELAKIAH